MVLNFFKMYVVSGTMFSLLRKLISNEGCLLHAFFCSSSAILDTPCCSHMQAGRAARARENARGRHGDLEWPSTVTVTAQSDHYASDGRLDSAFDSRRQRP